MALDVDELEDERLLALARSGDAYAQDCLVTKYQRMVRAKARSYYLVGADREDIIQEGMLGLSKAIRDYRSDRLASFRSFAATCVTRQMITAIKTATRQKHLPLNTAVSVYRPIYDEGQGRMLIDTIPAEGISDPQDLVIGREEFSTLRQEIGQLLSDLEWRVLAAYLDGQSYQEIAETVDRHIKAVDNALFRIKRKLARHLQERENRVGAAAAG